MMSVVSIKKNDTVRVLSGRDKGKQGKVTQVFPRLGLAVVDGANIRSKHLKSKRGGTSGSRVQFSAPLAVAKLAVVCPHCGKTTRVRMQLSAAGKRVRVCHRCSQALVSST